MCGISGLIGSKAKKANIEKMTALQKHRGHDHIGHQVHEGRIALGHNRLSIIDLNRSADQPFKSKDGNYSMVYNGEIYNYLEIREELEKDQVEFNTSSDTEVLLKAYVRWGEKCLEKFNGMFAFAIYDHHKQSLFMARDRFGVKPLYYALVDDNLIFASEIKAIHQFVKPNINKKVLANYLAHGSYGLPNETFYKNIHQLPGGYKAFYNDGELNLSQWYDFVERTKKMINEHENIKWDEALDTYRSLLENSIQLRFRADVPVGFNLSGGVDSSLLLALVNQRKDADQVKAFTFYTDDQRYDELYWVEQMVELTQTELNKVKFTSDDFEDWHERISYVQDEPYGGLPTLAYAKLFQTASDQGVKVLLDGQGMDEAWAGYDYYQNSSQQIIQGQKENGSPFKMDCMTEELRSHIDKPAYPQPFNDELLDKQYRDLFYTKIPRALRFNDRISMAATTELREPFLDYRLVEFAFSLPRTYKIHDGQGKYMLRRLLGSYNAEDVALAPKRPLQTPQREWLGVELRAAVEQELDGLENTMTNYLDPDKVKAYWQAYKAGDQSTSFHIWQWLSVLKLKRDE